MVAVARTIPTIDLMKIRTDMGLSREKMARIVDVSSKTIERWEKGETQPTSRRVQRLYAGMQEICEVGLMVYKPEGLKLFLRSKLPDFDGQTAFDMLELGDTESVIGALAMDYEGLGF
ncbi:MAG: helix-turn-helix transcriptional regulator [Thermomicrobiales bacterium]|nr:helix-turn-helix transcriptional regulator [Thermomicrobiales bacterium]